MNGAFMIHLVIWMMIIAFMISIGIVGFWTIQYRQFSAAMQDTIARCGTFHQGKGDANVINNPEIMDLIHRYHDIWVVEPVPNLSSYNGATLNTRAIHGIVGDQGMKTITMNDFESSMGKGRSSFNGLRRTKVQPDYLYNKLEPVTNIYGKLEKPERTMLSKTEAAANYNSGGSVKGIKPQYLDLTGFNANWLAGVLNDQDMPHISQYGELSKHGLEPSDNVSSEDSFYYPLDTKDKNHYWFNGVEHFGQDGYRMADANIWNYFVALNGNMEPQTKYAGQVAYIIVPNVNPDGKKNTNSLAVGTALFTFNLKWLSNKGNIQLVTNQVRSVATRGVNADVAG